VGVEYFLDQLLIADVTPVELELVGTVLIPKQLRVALLQLQVVEIVDLFNSAPLSLTLISNPTLHIP